MLAKKYRLPSYLISQVLKKGKRFHSSSFTVIISSAEQQLPRFAFIVSTKFDKRATRRNRFKRQLRETIRANLGKIKSGYNIIIFKADKQGEKDSLALRQELMSVLKKVKILKL